MSSLFFRTCHKVSPYSFTSVRFARILASDKIEKICGETFRLRGNTLDEKPGISKVELLKIIGEYDGLVVRSNTKVDKEIIAAAGNIKVIGRAGTGVDNIDVQEATRKGILVANTPGANTISTAELTLAHIFSLARQLPQSSSGLKKNENGKGWSDRSKYMGMELNGKVLGVVGLGKIGAHVASVCKALGMQIIAFDPNPASLATSSSTSTASEIEMVSFEQLVGRSDVITLHTPLTQDTKHLFNDQVFEKCKKGVKIVNCARGGIVDEEALLRALANGSVSAVGLDVLEEEPPKPNNLTVQLLLAHPQVTITPHLGAYTDDAQERVAQAIAHNLSDILQGTGLPGVVNPPPRSTGSVSSDPSTSPSVPYPSLRPDNANFSSGPCAKRPGYSLSGLERAGATLSLGRSHRSAYCKTRIQLALQKTRELLRIPEDYRVGIVPGSDTGAYEMAMWNMLGAPVGLDGDGVAGAGAGKRRPVDCCYWESFGQGWKEDVATSLQLPKDGYRVFSSPYGSLPDLASTDPSHDILFTYNGTTSGAKIGSLDWIADDRTGLTFNDATSAVFAMDMDWKKLDVTTFSWQKVLGGEGAHGVMVLSPRAVKRLQTFHPEEEDGRPIPKVFRMKKKQQLDEALFKGDTINTPSMLCIEDYLDALDWAASKEVGGLDGLIERSTQNLGVLEEFVSKREWIQFLVADTKIRSNTSVCLTLPGLSKAQVTKFVALLEKENVAFDIGSYRDAPIGLRIWCGATVEKKNLERLCPWLDWAYEMVQRS